MVVISKYKDDSFSNIEYESFERISWIQTELLVEHIRYAAENSPFYNELFAKCCIDPYEIKSVEDLKQIPFTTKDDLTDRNDDFLAVRKSEIADICLTSATTKDVPAKLMQTQEDLLRLAYNEEMAFTTMGLNQSDTILICAAIDRCFMAGLAYYLGGLRIGACMVRAGSGSPAQQWQMLKTSGVTAIIGVPSLIKRIGEYALEAGENPAAMNIKRIGAIGEPARGGDLQSLPGAAVIEKMWNAHIYSTYASTEIATTFCECEYRCGGHQRPELIVFEIVDENGNNVDCGDPGEVVVTPLGVKGMPLIRFKTGDIAYQIQGQCRCGRNTPRISPIIGRKNQMLKYKGTTVFPNTFLSIIEGCKNIAEAYLEVCSNPDNTDRLILHIAPRPGGEADIKILTDEIRAKARVVPEIVIDPIEDVSKKVYMHDKRKKVTFYDMRKNND